MKQLDRKPEIVLTHDPYAGAPRYSEYKLHPDHRALGFAVATFERKVAAMSAHVSQFGRYPNVETFLRQRAERVGKTRGITLNPQKARVLAMLALTVTAEILEIERIFGEH